MALLRLLLPLLPLAATVAGTQWPLTGNLRRPEAYEGFTAVGALRNAVSGEGFTTFGHPLFPGYSARIRHLEHWCDEQVGYVVGVVTERSYRRSTNWNDRAVELIPATSTCKQGTCSSTFSKVRTTWPRIPSCSGRMEVSSP